MRGQINELVVSNNLKSARIKAGLLQDQVAERLGVSRQTMSSYETDPGKLKLAQFLQLAEIYGCSIGYFFGLMTDNMSNEQLHD